MKISTEDKCGGSQQQVGPMVSSATAKILVKIGLLCFPLLITFWFQDLLTSQQPNCLAGKRDELLHKDKEAWRMHCVT